MEEQQQQQQPPIHPFVLEAIARLSDPLRRAERHKLYIFGSSFHVVERHSWEHLVDFIDDSDSHEVEITELHLLYIHFTIPSDGGLQVMCDFFSRSDTTITKVTLNDCHFGTEEEESQLLAAFHTNRTVTDLTLDSVVFQYAACGASISGWVQNIPQLQRLSCTLDVGGIRAFQPTLQANRTLRVLGLGHARFDNDSMGLLADALVDNPIIEILEIGSNIFTFVGLDHITRILERTRLQEIDLHDNSAAFTNGNATRRFARAVSRHQFLKNLNLTNSWFPEGGFHIFALGLAGNSIMEVLDISENRLYFDGYDSSDEDEYDTTKSSNRLDDITRLIQSTQIKSIDMSSNDNVFANEAATQRFAHAISRHQFLKDLDISNCNLGDAAIRMIADEFAAAKLAGAGNTIMEVFNISGSRISHVGLPHITRLLESTRLKTISFFSSLQGVNSLFSNEIDTQHFVTTLRDKQSSVQELPDIGAHCFPPESQVATYDIIKNSLLRNEQLNHVDSLLAPLTPSVTVFTMWRKTCHKAITKLALVPNDAGASAIFKLFTARPQLLEKRITRPPSGAAAAAAATTSHDDTGNDNTSAGGGTDNRIADEAIDGQQRQHLS